MSKKPTPKRSTAAAAATAVTAAAPTSAAPPVLRAGWTAPHPEPLPRPTFWPASLAFAVTFLLWGFVTSPLVTGMGALLFMISLAGWIGDIRHETRSH